MKRNDAGLRRIAKTLTNSEREAKARLLGRIAFHEAGHAVVAARVGMCFKAVSISDDPDYQSAVWVAPHGGTAERIRDNMTTLAAGQAAEAYLTGAPPDGGAADDDRFLLDRARVLLGIGAPARRIDREISAARRRADKILKQFWPEVERLAAMLLDLHRQLTAICPRRKEKRKCSKI